MTYFDFLRMTRKEDTKETFIDFLLDFCDLSEAEAEKEAKYFYE